MKKTRKQRERDERQLVWLAQILSQAQHQEWWGEIRIKIEGGVMKRANMNRSLVPPQ